MELLFEFELEYDEDSPFGKDPEADLAFFLEEMDDHAPGLDKELISRAFWYCHEKHIEHKRKSGYPYYTHPLQVALILVKEFPIFDSAAIAATLLHDVIEDVEGVLKDDIAREFSPEIAEMVDAVTKIAHSNISENKGMSKLASKAYTYRKLFMELVKDVRVIIIKLADRLHNLRTLHYLKPEKQKDIALETINFYIPFAHRLGLSKVKRELENRSFYYSDREAYEAIKSELKDKRLDFIDYIRVFTDMIGNALNEQGIGHVLSIVHKHEYEIYKMIEEGKNISDIDNFYSIVLILRTNDVHECYRAHGVLANAFNAVSFVDYIANPTPDWYKSLKTELFGPDGKRVEILLRTEEMEKIAEEGFASSFALKAGRMRALSFDDAEIRELGEWMQDMIETEGEKASKIIWDMIKVNLFDNELSLFTKEGGQVTLPQNSNIIDFAFSISEETGFHCITGKVNGVFRDLRYKLTSGEQIEILTSPNSKPKPDWRREVVSHKAISKLHKYFKENSAEDTDDYTVEHNYDARLRIHGEDRSQMLQDISQAIGKANIKRINLDTSGNSFEGIITVNVYDDEELNQIFSKLLRIKGINGVFRIEEADG